MLHAGRRSPGFLDEFGALGVGLRHHFLALGFGLVQLRFDFLGVGDALPDLFTPQFQHREDALVGELVEDGAHDREADDLRHQMRPVHAEGPGDLRDLAVARVDGQ